MQPTMSSSHFDAAHLLLLFLPKTVVSPLIAVALIAFSVLWISPGGLAWALSWRHSCTIQGPSGFVLALAGTAAHRVLAGLSRSLDAVRLMAFSVGLTRFVVASHPDTAKEILNSPSFADRPIKESAYELLFHRAMGFAPFGEYWRSLRRISATHMFSPRRIKTSEEHRQAIGERMVEDIGGLMAENGAVEVKKLLHFGSLSNLMMSVFGKRYDFGEEEGKELESLVKEGYELLGAFNWADHFPLLGRMDVTGVRRRCRALVKRVNVFVESIIEEHREKRMTGGGHLSGEGDFVDVLLGLQKEEKLTDSDMVAVLWELIFRGTDTIAILLEWIMARMVLHPDIQSKAQSEIDAAVGSPRRVSDADVVRLPLLQAIVKKSLRLHPPGPLLSWARLAIHDVLVGDHLIPAGTTAMVNMWAITHDPGVWAEPEPFKPERFLAECGGEEVSVLGSDLRLAPFGAGRRVCPGKAMGLATVHLWLAQLLQAYEWAPAEGGAVDLSECLKMSMEMEKPLVCRAIPRS